MAEEYTLLSPKEVSGIFAVSVKWVYKNATLLGGSKIGGRLFFPLDRIADAVQGGQHAPGDHRQECPPTENGAEQ